MNNDLSFLDGRKDWHCAMCGIGLEEAVKQEYPLTRVVTDMDDWKRRRKQYFWERTQENPHLTCCRSCGYNYKAWKLNFDSKKSYIKGQFTCETCHEIRIGGRILKNHKGKDVKECRYCHRKRITLELRKQWEELNRDYLNEYHRKWRKKKKNAIASSAQQTK